MTLSLRTTAVSLQAIGLLGSLLAVLASYAFMAYCGGSIWVAAALIAVALDVIALRATSSHTQIGAAVLKPVAFLMFNGILISCAPPRLPLAEPLLPTWTGPALLIYSSIPSILGAILRRLSR